MVDKSKDVENTTEDEGKRELNKLRQDATNFKLVIESLVFSALGLLVYLITLPVLYFSQNVLAIKICTWLSTAAKLTITFGFIGVTVCSAIILIKKIRKMHK